MELFHVTLYFLLACVHLYLGRENDIFIDYLFGSYRFHFDYRLWDIECGACLRVLEGHEELVRCIRFDSKRIVSGAYDGYVNTLCSVSGYRSSPPTRML
jgi:hypothetical protein